MNKKVKAVIYVRVSKAGMEYDRQIADLTVYAEKMNYQVIEVISEKVSGSSKTNQREGLLRVLKLAEQKKYDKLLISEVSRLGRTTEVHRVVELLTQFKVSIFINNYNLETLDESDMPNSTVGMMLTILSEFSRVEKETLVQRINSGLQQARRDGKVLGRRKDSTKSKSQYFTQYKSVVRLVNKGLSLREIATIENCSVNTVRKVKSLLVL